MYKANKRHLQPLLISNVNDLPEKKRKRLANSWADDFFQNFFSRINEDAFAVLYVDFPSRPNVPINWLIGLETLKAGFGWSDEELYDHFCFDLQVRYALGIHDLNESDFELRSLYYFRERLSRYNLEHGVNLLTQAFEQITSKQLKVLEVKAGKQRMDSTQVASNILEMSRLQLLVEAVQRLQRKLSEADQQRYAETFAPYLQGHSGQVVYHIKGKEAAQAHLQQIGEVIYLLLEELRDSYAQEPAYQVLTHCFADHFRLVAQEVRPKSHQELRADSLQAVDDLEATYRRKGRRDYKGYVANLSETCDPDNALQLITKVQVAPNHTNDRDLLLEALPDLRERTTLETLYTDGAYSGTDVDLVLAQHQVEQIQTGIVGKIPDPSKLSLADFEIELNEPGIPTRITCPQGQSVPVKLSNRQKSYQADFDPLRCQTCPHHLTGDCPAKPGKKRPSFRLSFPPSRVTVAQRRRKMLQSRQEGKNHRAAIEGTVREVKHPYPTGKLPVRGLFRMTCVMVSSAAMTNIRRIHHYWEGKRKEERRKMVTETGMQAGQTQQEFSLSSFLKALFIRKRAFMVFPSAAVSC